MSRLRFSRIAGAWLAGPYRVDLVAAQPTYRRVWVVRYHGMIIGRAPAAGRAKLIAEMHAREIAAWRALRLRPISAGTGWGAETARRALAVLERSVAALAGRPRFRRA